MTSWATPLRPGLPVSFDGDQFTVAEIEGSRVMLRRTGTVGAASWRQVELVALLSHPSTRILTAAPEPQAAVAAMLGGLDAGEDEDLTARYRHVQEVRTGYQHGCAELALEGEPRPQYAAGVPMMARYRAKAAELGIGVSTVRRWVMQAHRSLMKNRRYVPGIGAVAKRWAWCGPGMVTKVLGGLDRDASLHARLRYATATPRPRWPTLPAGAITRRAAMVPAMLWPGWTLRLLPQAPGGADTGDDAPHSARCSSFRRGCASFLLLPGGPPQLNFERASPLLGNRSHVTDRDAVERIIYRERDLTPLASVLAQLASALDEHGSPIDYARRRALFTGPESVTLDLDAYTRLCLQHGWSRSYAPRLAVMRWYLLVLLTGEHPAIVGTRKPFSWYCTSFRYSAPGPLRDFLHQQAQASLARHGITEPVTWEPPAHWVSWEDWPGTDPASLSGNGLAAVLAKAGSVHGAAGALGMTAEHVRLSCEIAGTGPVPATANGLPVSPSRADVLAPARLRDLYEHQNLPVTEIAALAGCATATIRRLLQIDGVPQRPAYRRPPPESGITREWLHREYAVKLRSIDTLARERGVSAPYLKSLAKNWGLPVRRHSDFSGIGHLDLPGPPSPAIRAVTMRTGALGRLEVITRVPGHDSIAAAARAFYGGRDGALQQMIAKIETAAGFPIIDRSTTPLSPTDAGRDFIREALQILRAAREQASAHPYPDGDARRHGSGHAEKPQAAGSTTEAI